MPTLELPTEQEETTTAPIDRYGGVLADYLRSRSEQALYDASLLSQAFVEAGVGPEEIVAIHFEALDQSLQGASYRVQARAIGDAHQFLLEIMIAYGVKYREYLDLKVRESEREAAARDELFATIAHELRNPIAAAATSLDVASRNLARGNVERATPLIGSAREALGRLSRLTADLVRASQRQPPELQRVPLALPELVAEGCGWARIAAEEKGVAFGPVDGPDDLLIEGDADALLSVVGNLLSNAVRYTPPGGSIAVRYGATDDRGWLEVADTGIGMSPEVQARIFEKFYRAREARAVEAQGLGLGLALVHELVAAHGGGVTVRSAPGEGSTFRVVLPLAAILA